MLKRRIPQVQKIPQHRNSELKFPKYRKKNGPIPQTSMSPSCFVDGNNYSEEKR